MKKIDDELGIDENFEISDEEEVEMEETPDMEDVEEPGDLDESGDNQIQKELARINQREKVEMGQEIEQLKKRLDERDLQVAT